MKKAVILFNLGGPDKLENVEPFLFNLFNDPAIINIPFIFRYPLAKFLSKRRAPVAKNIYREIGNKSPILELTINQATSLENNLSEKGDYKCFVVMRCWNPRATDVIKKVREYNPNEIILLPLYPQYSASTSGSSIKEWNDLCKSENYKVKTENIVNGLKNAKNIGRLEQLKDGRLKKLAPTNTIYLDACHNELGAVACAKFIETLNTPVNLILAMMENKEHKDFISKFKNKINSVQVCSIPNNPNCIEKENLNQIVLKAGIKSEIANSIEDAIKKLAQKDPASVIMVCGSIYFLGEVLNLNS